MNIKIVDSWLRENLKTKVSARDIAKELSLTSVSVERVEKVDEDFVYDIEVTTNRPDLMSVEGIAREAAASLRENDNNAQFVQEKDENLEDVKEKFPLEIEADEKLVNRISAVVMDVEVGKSPAEMSKRLELSGIRSLNNLMDITNYVMRQTGHPTHVFDLDRLNTKRIVIRASKPGEQIETLDGKKYNLAGEDIVAQDDNGRIVDLLGIMGTNNSVVTENTKRILFFLDNNNPSAIRKTSMNLGIRTEAAIINEKGIDPNIIDHALSLGVSLFKKIAKGKVSSEVFDFYPNKPKQNTINVNAAKIGELIGIEISLEKCAKILTSLGFYVKTQGDSLEVVSPTIRPDVKIEEDVIEEIARIYGYHKLPSIIPTFQSGKNIPFANNFYFEQRVKNALKYYGLTEVYTNSLVSEDLYEGPIEDALRVSNPLSQDLVFLRNSLIPSLLNAVNNNKTANEISLFEMANIYLKKEDDLPKEVMTLSAVIKNNKINFYEIKGLVEQILNDLGIYNLTFKKSQKSATGSSIFIDKELIGEIEILDSNLVDFELNFEIITKHANLKKIFKPFAKFPSIIEDISVITNAQTEEIINSIKEQSNLIIDVQLKDSYQNSRTFHIIYQDFEKNLTSKDIQPIREKIIVVLKNKFSAEIKE